MKVINDLLGYKNYKIVQDTNYFSFSLDSVLLARFVSINKNTKNVLDIGTGNAPIPMILSTVTNANIVGFEIQKEVFSLGIESIVLNNLNEKITLINDDIKNINRYYDQGFFDVIISNPPYFKLNNESKINKFEQKSIARHEIKLNLEELLEISSKYLKNNGTFAMVHRTDRLIDIIELMRKYHIEPKRIQFIYSKKDSNSNMLLIEGKKNGKPGLKIMPAIFSHFSDGSYTKEVMNKFFLGGFYESKKL